MNFSNEFVSGSRALKKNFAVLVRFSEILIRPSCRAYCPLRCRTDGAIIALPETLKGGAA
jgi:hypothetical protein